MFGCVVMHGCSTNSYPGSDINLLLLLRIRYCACQCRYVNFLQKSLIRIKSQSACPDLSGLTGQDEEQE